jgi:hypothetical protein
MKKIILLALLIGVSINSFSQDERDLYINGE